MVVPPSGSYDACVSGTAWLSLNLARVVFCKGTRRGKQIKEIDSGGYSSGIYCSLYFYKYSSFSLGLHCFLLFRFLSRGFLLAPAALRGKQITDRRGCGAGALGKLLSNLATI